MKEILEAIAEDMMDQTNERDYELDWKINHSSDDELYELLAEFGY